MLNMIFKTRTILFVALTITLGASAQAMAQEPNTVRFVPVDIYADSDGAPLAGYHLSIDLEGSDAKIVGIENGEHAAFQKPPYYDPKALYSGKIIIAAISTAQAKDLPHGKHRLATLHLRVVGELSDIRVQVLGASDADAKSIQLNITTQKRPRHAGEGNEQ